MKLKKFVSISALVIAGWLGFTFMHEVPTQAYPRLDKHTADTRKASTSQPMEMAKKSDRAQLSSISVSH